jgi:hypothetical protein
MAPYAAVPYPRLDAVLSPEEYKLTPRYLGPTKVSCEPGDLYHRHPASQSQPHKALPATTVKNSERASAQP